MTRSIDYVRPDARFSINFTSMKGALDIDFADLVRVFGKPNGNGDSYKVDAEWILRTPVGVATIYNYKTGRNYLGAEGLPVKQIQAWHVGGHADEVVEWIMAVLDRADIHYSVTA